MFGRLAACDAAGTDLLPRVRKTRAVLAILALAAPRPVPRSELVSLLWSRRGLPQAQGSLRQAVHELRLALGQAASLLRSEPGYLALSDVGLQVDALQILRSNQAAFEAGAPSSGALAADGSWSGEMAEGGSWQEQLLGDLVGLDPAFDRWLGERSRHVRQCLRTLGEVALAAAEESRAISTAADRLLLIDGAHEGAWRALIQGHITRGDWAAAVACYERCRAALATNCQVGPSAETTALVATLRPQQVPAAPGLLQIADVVIAPRRLACTRVRLGVATLRANGADGTAELAAGLAEELIVALSRFRWIGCMHCATGQVEHDVDFFLGGAVQRSGDRIRVLLRLSDRRAGGEVVWAERFECDVTEVFALQDWLAGTTAARLEPQLWLWEGARVAAGHSDPRTAPDLLRLAVPAVYRLDRSRFMAAGRLLIQSVALDPENASAHAWAAHWHIFAVGQGWTPTPAADIERARGLAERAILLDPYDARGLSLAGHVRGFIDRRPEEAHRLHERAIEMNPNLPLSWCLSGLSHIYAGDCDAAIREVRHAQSLAPDDPLAYFFEMALALAYLLRGDAAGAALAAQRAVHLNVGFSSSGKTLLSALGHLGQREAANDARAALLVLEPGFTVEQAMHRTPLAASSGRGLYAEGLRLGGLG
jgi:DNA-binding SARP family transcriptional activator/TolB-like protein